MTVWLDPLSFAVRSAVVSGAWGRAPHTEHGNPVPTPPAIDTITEALTVASDILTRLTAFTVHPALQVVEDFVAHPRATRLFPSFAPVRTVLSVTRFVDEVGTVADPLGWTAFGGAIYFAPDCGTTVYSWLQTWCGCQPQESEHLRVTYNAGSTITASARRAVLALAHEYWLDTSGCDECGPCALPSRTTSVQREGLSYNVGDPEGQTELSMTGIPAVDFWVRANNPTRATRIAGVWTPDSPPPAVRSVKTARPIFPVSLDVGVAAFTGSGSLTAAVVVP